MLGRTYGVRLEVPDFPEEAFEKRVKRFCVGALENPVNHTWWKSVSTVGLRERCSILATLFLCRKAMPVPPDPFQKEKHMALMQEPAPEPPRGYLDHIDREIDLMFPIGWDRDYTRHVFQHTPTTSSTLESGRSLGGAQDYLASNGKDWFEDQCLGESVRPTEYPVRYSVVRTKGKDRGVTVAPGYSHVLAPLHRTLYDYCSRFEWLLRGEARGKRFKSFSRKRGEVFVSGDYESATDNLSLSVAERILSRILSRARHVPVTLRGYAMRSLRAEIDYDGERVVQRRGQLMGNFLSFPLLCLQNKLAFSYLVPREVPLRINGDDIVFRCRRSEYRKWAEGVGRLGLTLSEGKTLVHSRFFSLNSAFFVAQSHRVREVPVIRGASLLFDDAPPSGGAFVRFIRNWKGDSRRLVGGLWLRWAGPQIRASGRSVEALGIPADNSQLHTAGLAVREAFFRGSNPLLRIPEVPVPLFNSRRDASGASLGYVKVTTAINATPAEYRRWDTEAIERMAAFRWERRGRPVNAKEEWWSQVRATGFESAWTSWKRTARRSSKMLGMGQRFCLNIRLRNPTVRAFRRARWVPVDELPARRLLFRGVGLT